MQRTFLWRNTKQLHIPKKSRSKLRLVTSHFTSCQCALNKFKFCISFESKCMTLTSPFSSNPLYEAFDLIHLEDQRTVLGIFCWNSYWVFCVVSWMKLQASSLGFLVPCENNGFQSQWNTRFVSTKTENIARRWHEPCLCLRRFKKGQIAHNKHNAH